MRRHALGLLLVRLGRFSDAMTELRMAAELAPGAPRFAYAYAIGLHSTGDTADAVDILAETAVTHPYDMDILTALVTLNLELGRRDEALDYASQLALIVPDDDRVMNLVHSLKNR
ncbi:MAG: tetratricopeptide repeat protein [Rhodothermales bacterium]|nr:tetratricopeptide repeat protein [Rhodothermales bacterium]